MRGNNEMDRNKHLDKLASQGGLTLATSLCIFLLRFGKSAIISRLLGPTYKGVFSLLTLIPALMIAFGNLGFGPAVVYYVAKQKYDLKKVMGGTIVFSVLMGLVLLLVGIMVLQLDFVYKGNAQLVRNYSVLILISIPILLLHRLGLTFLMAKAIITSLNIIRVLESVFPLIFFIALWLLMDNALDAAVWSWFIGIMIIVALPFILIRHKGTYPPKFGTEFLKKGLSYGIAGHFANFFQMVLLRIDFLFISGMLGAKELGYYAIATSIAEMLLVVPESVGVPLAPMLFGMDKKESEKFTPVIARFIFALMGLSCIVVLLIGKFFIELVFGVDFLPAYPSLILLLPGMIALGLYGIIKIDLFGRKMPGTVSLLTGIAVAVNLALNYFTIPRWGIRGAAISSSFSYLLCLVLLLFVYFRHSGNNLVKTLLLTKSDTRKIYEYLKEKLIESRHSKV